MQIRSAIVAEARLCAGIVAAALLDDPVGARAIPGRADRLRRLTSLYEAELRVGSFDHGAVDVAVVDGVIVGVAAWESPRLCRRRAALLRQAPRYAFAIGPVHAGVALRTLGIRRRARPEGTFVVLADIAVAASARGLGVGTALLEHGLARGDDGVYLEATTPASRRLYERHGFVMRSEIGLVADGYPVAMWRAPRLPMEPALA
ncbi:hypothetical protein GCM10009846_13470 [Agrococcus versicolor]|uniref:N-acetyltransferase domain-containing protein n=1 Tax=Agrococcus versicolor TaxID=501482 RepID=A0ABN3APC1_9MICO